LNETELNDQRKDIEMERLETQMKMLMIKNESYKDLEMDNKILQQRLEQAEQDKQDQLAEIQAYKKELIDRENNYNDLLMLKDELQAELARCADQMTEMETKVFKSNKVSLDLIADIKRMQMDVGFYIPEKNDRIDTLLADFINNSRDKQALKLMFVKNNDGQYYFGTKKLNIKIENGLKVRVGGGYLSIDEFVDQYLPIEMDKYTGLGQLAERLESPNIRKS
jgi:hypothetical protein